MVVVVVVVVVGAVVVVVLLLRLVVLEVNVEDTDREVEDLVVELRVVVVACEFDLGGSQSTVLSFLSYTIFFLVFLK